MVTNETDVEFDVVAHEVGHAVLHYLRPELNNNYNNDYVKFQIRALHEAFADSSAIFSSIYFIQNYNQQTITELLLNKDNFSAIAPKFKKNMFGLRNTTHDNDYAKYFTSGSFHDFSLIVSKLIQDIMYIVVKDAFSGMVQK